MFEKSQTATLEIKCTFDLDLLPVSFGSRLEETEEGNEDRTSLNQAINELAQTIWQNSGFWFRLVGMNPSPYLLYKFCCCQDVKIIKAASANKK